MPLVQVAYLGPEGTYSHEAALAAFPNYSLKAQVELQAVVEAVYRTECKYGVLPIENSTNGSVYPAIKAIQSCQGRVKIHGDLYVPVRHMLYAFGRNHFKRLYSHPQVWGQIEKFTKNGDYELIDCTSTAAALEEAQKDESGAAVASLHGGQVVGLKPTIEDISDYDNNQTRFVVLSCTDPLVPTATSQSTLFVLVNPDLEFHGRRINRDLLLGEVNVGKESGHLVLGYSGIVKGDER